MNTSALVTEIACLQLKTATSAYPAGLFPSQRRHLFLPVKREDSNIFFSASVVFILESVAAYLSQSDQKLIQEIAASARNAYPLYRNKNGLKTYNFWQTNPSRHLPNGLWMHRFNHFKLPDDIDTTSLIYLTNKPSRETVLWLHQKMAQHANLVKLQVKTTLPKFQKLGAYSTWFGEKMPIEFDVCVHCNALLLLLKHQVPLNFHDQETIKFIRGIVQEKLYFKSPYRISPAYPNPAIILYHMARLISEPNAILLADLKPSVISDLKKCFETVSVPMEKVILDTSLMRLGEPGQFTVKEEIKEEVKSRGFYWFTAAFLSVYGSPFVKPLARFTFSHLKFNCAAFNLALLLEHEFYRQNALYKLVAVNGDALPSEK
jgi:hypothetical protein